MFSMKVPAAGEPAACIYIHIRNAYAMHTVRIVRIHDHDQGITGGDPVPG